MSRGRLLNDSIVDGTATLAMEICASGLWSGLTSPSRPWMALTTEGEADADGKAWLQDTQEQVYATLARSNFYTETAQVFRDTVTFGTAPMLIYEDGDRDIRCFLPCAGEYFLAIGSTLEVDTLYREFTWTVSQIVEMFQLENCPEEIRSLWRQGGASLDTERVVAHAIEPNFPIERSGGGEIHVVAPVFAWREIYWIKGNKEQAELSRRGFHERPFVVARWSTVSNDPYGRGIGARAAGDIKQLQMETRRKAEFIQKLTRPPMLAGPELKNEPASIEPDSITYVNSVDGKRGFWPAFEMNPAALGPMIADIKEVQSRIDRYFFVDVFMAISRMEGVQPRNELELTKRDLERLQVLGPFIHMFENEFASPAIERVIAILGRKGKLKPLPDSLRGHRLRIEYASIMKLAQESAEGVGLKDFAVSGAAAAEAAQAAGIPNPLRIVNWDMWYRRLSKVQNVDQDIMFTQAEVVQHDQARAQLEKQQQQISTGQAAVTAASQLGNTSVAPGTALGALLAHGGGQPLNPAGGGQ